MLNLPASERPENSSTFIPQLVQLTDDVAKTIAMSRHYMKRTADGDVQFTYDPRFLVFEFIWNIQLRKNQIDIIDDFREKLRNGESKVKQMVRIKIQNQLQFVIVHFFLNSRRICNALPHSSTH